MQEDSLEVQTYLKIRNMMLNFELIPGQRLVISELAEQLGVSRTPVKIAVIMLYKEGYLDYSARKSYYMVHQLTKEEHDQLHDFRRFLELGAAEKAIINITPESLREMERRAQVIRETAASDDHRLRFTLELNFHSLILELSENRYILDTFHDTFQRFFMRRHISRHYGARYEEFLNEHDAIVEAFRSEDIVRVREALLEHIDNGKEFIDSIYF
ncbi:GntR family transcriptional regulator [Pelobacter seleniigenes]|uniref:GntR family transcriptional regulator n=1 Tax=Pelobacter seleniigenes TaxID=407188 RepID=UPI0004A774DE|nr:GntR family transcriptional regulator [Pelobacter seleniigenes]